MLPLVGQEVPLLVLYDLDTMQVTYDMAAALGALQFGAMYTFYVASFRHLAAWQVALWTVFTPLMVVLIDDVMARRTRWRPWLAALLAVGMVTDTAPLGATEIERERAQQVIEEVLADEAFGERRSLSYWKYTGERTTQDDEHSWWGLVVDFIEGFLQGFAAIGEVLLWVAGAVILLSS